MEQNNYFNNTASPAKLFQMYRRYSIIVMSTTTRIWFNHQCLNRGLTPRYIYQNHQSNSTKLNELSKKIIKLTIRETYKKQNHAYLQLKAIYDSLKTKHSFEEMNWKIGRIRNECRRMEFVTRKRMEKKLTNLVRRRKEERRTGEGRRFYKRVMNLTTVPFSEEEEGLLQYGFKHNPIYKNSRNEYEQLLVDADMAIEKIEHPNRSSLKQHIAYELKQHFKKEQHITTQNPEVKSIREKAKLHNIVFTKADKGNTMIILNRQDYIDRVEKFLNENHFQVVSKYSVDSFNNKVKKVLKNCTQLIDDKLRYSLTTHNFQIPKLYGLMKIHKTEDTQMIPIRPVVSSINTPTQKIARFLNNKLRHLIEFNPKYVLKNSQDLIAKIKDVKIPDNSFLISLDVTNLYTNVPVEEVKEIVKEHLITNNIDQEILNNYVSLLDICLQQNVCIFNDKKWKQLDGLAMGSPISCLLADIFMDNFENKFMIDPTLLRFTKEIVYYYRYVDDIIILWKGNQNDLNDFVNRLNSRHTKIKFTLELQKNNKLNFLDLTLEIINNTHNFDIFRKPTYTDNIIHNKSNHPWQHKMAAFNFLVHRLVYTPLSKSNFEKEKNIIFNIAHNNGYNANLINRLINRKIHKKQQISIYPRPTEPLEPTQYISIHFIGKGSHFLAQKLRSLDKNITVAFKPINSLQKLLVNNKDITTDLDKSGVYRLKCNDCNAEYIGKTYRHLKTRIKEHLYAMKSGSRASHFANHLIEFNHNFDINNTNNFSILHSHNNNSRLLKLEALEIYKSLNNNNTLSLNIQTEFLAISSMIRGFLQ